MRSAPPLVLCIAGHDPTGGAGILADAAAVAAQGAHTLTVISAYTVQDSRNVHALETVSATWLAKQIDTLLDDCDVAAIKIGLLGDAGQIPVLLRTIERCRVPVVIDPVLRAGGGRDLVAATLQAALVEQLLPMVTLATPNAAEARRLAAIDGNSDACAAVLLASGCDNLLITGGDEATAAVQNRWYARGAHPVAYEWPRLPGGFHGAGCTLASAIAARLALGEPLAAAIENGQRWTQQSLASAYAVGKGRPIPNRRPA